MSRQQAVTDALQRENEELKLKLNEMKNKIQSREMILRDGNELPLCLSLCLSPSPSVGMSLLISMDRNRKESNLFFDSNEN
jgi:cell shape-determining protein MreC